MKQGGLFTETKRGFTIVETLIVLAVTSGLFVMAAVMINGRTTKTEFQVAARDLQTRIQQVVNETGSGYYPMSGNFNCSKAGAAVGDRVLTLTPGGTTSQGSHDDCIFIGKTFVISGSNIFIFSLAGLRADLTTNEEVTTPVQAHLTAIAPGTTTSTSAPDFTETATMPYGVKLVGADYGENLSQVSSTPIYAFSIMSSLANADATPAQSTQKFDLYGFNSTGFSESLSRGQLVDLINKEQTQATAFPKRQQVHLCLKSGGTNQLALITIGGQGSTAVRMQIQNDSGGGRCQV